MKGIELELIGLVSESLSFDLRVAYLDTEITSSYEALDNFKSGTILLWRRAHSLFTKRRFER
ncbi:MAG: hypothetical protein Ct9H90mP6_11510 [Gammaproteobacteria bacterium]|nr:MAG: hypothetical protein Ct9H90mP6_11510 [Gammaproteobacteria bacterium]